MVSPYQIAEETRKPNLTVECNESDTDVVVPNFIPRENPPVAPKEIIGDISPSNIVEGRLRSDTRWMENNGKSAKHSALRSVTIGKDIPRNMEEVLALPEPIRSKWIEAIKSQVNSLISTNTFTAVELPEGKTVVQSRNVLTIKLDEQGNIVKYKSRICAKGYTQRAGVDYKDTFAPTGTSASLRALIAIASHMGWDMQQTDTITAFLLGGNLCKTTPWNTRTNGMGSRVSLETQQIFIWTKTVPAGMARNSQRFPGEGTRDDPKQSGSMCLLLALFRQIS